LGTHLAPTAGLINPYDGIDLRSPDRYQDPRPYLSLISTETGHSFFCLGDRFRHSIDR